jgi:L-2-hydroxyglutarate oxidase LhgO
LEPALQCTAALLSVNSGIVDSHGLMTSLLGDAESAGATLALASPIARAERLADRWRVWVGSGVATGAASGVASQVGSATNSPGTEPDGFELHTRWLINAAGLDAQAVAHAMHGFPAEHIPARHLARGHYFSLQGRAPFSRLIYPTPQDGGLGVHLTLDLGGQAKFGPDVEWLSDAAVGQGSSHAPGPALADTPGDALDYRVDASRSEAFAAEVRRYWPGLPDGALAPAYSGIRPKLSGPGEPAADFRIDGPAEHGCPGVVQLFGIESPGLTASLAIAKEVLSRVQASGG